MAELLEMTQPELFIVAVTMVLCVIGLLLPRFGNQIGKAVMGEDPAVTGLRKAWADRRALRRAQRKSRKAAAKARKAARKAAKLARTNATPSGDVSKGDLHV